MADYGFEHDGKVFTPNQTTGIDAASNDARNEALEAAELAHWATQPERFIAYYELGKGACPDGKVTTWLGTRIGSIVAAHVYRHNFGSRMVSIRVQGTNGAMYYGRASFDWGSCINLRKAKRTK